MKVNWTSVHANIGNLFEEWGLNIRGLITAFITKQLEQSTGSGLVQFQSLNNAAVNGDRCNAQNNILFLSFFLV